MSQRRDNILTGALIVAILAIIVYCFAGAAEAHTAKTHVKVILSEDQCPGTTRANIEIDHAVLGCYFEQPSGAYNVFWSDHDPLTLAHELGHVYDATSLTEPYRVQFRELFNLQSVPWRSWFTTALGDTASPSEWFAEGYGRCKRHSPVPWLSAYDYNPTRAQHRAVCRLIWSADRDRP